MQGDRTGKTAAGLPCPSRFLAGICVSTGCDRLRRARCASAPYSEPAQPVRDLAAKRAGDTVHLTFSVPQKTTDKLPVRGAMTAQSLPQRGDRPLPARRLRSRFPRKQKSFAWTTTCPPALTQGPPRLLTYKSPS